MKNASCLIAALLACAGCGSSPALAPIAAAPAAATPVAGGGAPAGWKLVWSDEFDKDGLPDPAKWAYDSDRNRAGWHNNELQYYAVERLENTRVQNGKLIITARRERLASAPDYGGQAYTSGRLFTKGRAEWTYGYMEIRAKLPCAVGTWPAIWTLGSSGSWPEMGEIDIMEHVGQKKGELLGSIHTKAYNWPANTQKTVRIQQDDVCDVFHNYQLRWEADRLAVGIDDRYYFEFKNPGDGDNAKWPFSKPQYLLLNLAIGGDLGGPVNDKMLPALFEIDYVRIYQP